MIKEKNKMKRNISIPIALTITVMFMVVGTTVWAGPNRQGTVPTLPDESDLVPGVTVTLGTVEVTSTVNGHVILIHDPSIEIGPAPEGLSFLSDAIVEELDKTGDITVCYPYPQAVKDKAGDIYKWNEDKEEWVISNGTVSGDPAKICFTDKGVKSGSYTLIGG